MSDHVPPGPPEAPPATPAEAVRAATTAARRCVGFSAEIRATGEFLARRLARLSDAGPPSPAEVERLVGGPFAELRPTAARLGQSLAALRSARAALVLLRGAAPFESSGAGGRSAAAAAAELAEETLAAMEAGPARLAELPRVDHAHFLARLNLDEARALRKVSDNPLTHPD